MLQDQNQLQNVPEDCHSLFYALQSSYQKWLEETNDNVTFKEDSFSEISENNETDFIITDLDKRSIVMRGLSRNTIADKVKEVAETVGQVKSLEMKATRKGLIAYVEFQDDSTANSALVALDSYIIDGQKVKCGLRKTFVHKREINK